ncbi:MAG: Crp/Fnr family transcriptional regulator [Chitinophagaceae bacterium]
MLVALEQYTSRFIGLSAEELAALMDAMEVRASNRRGRLIDIGEQEHYCHFILHGLVRKFFYRGKHEVITQLAKEGELISSSVSFFTGQPSEYVIEAIEETKVLSLHKQRMEELYRKYPKLEKLGRLVITDLILRKSGRELEMLRYNTRQRFVRFMNQHHELFQRVPQKYLASYLDIKPETFSRLKHLLIPGRNPGFSD